MSENINPSLFNEFFELSLIGYAKILINTKNPNENKEFVAEIENRISDLKDRIKEMSETEKKKERMRYQRLLKQFLITKKCSKFFFPLHQELIKENQNKNLIDQFLNGCKCQKKDLIL